METVGAFEAKTHLASLLNRVAKGEQITITKHGVPVAILAPVVKDKKPDIESIIKEMRELSNGVTLGDLTLREMIDEGRP